MKLLLSVAILLQCAAIQAQNVGIGTNHPLSKLHVAGDVRIDNLVLARDSGIVFHNTEGVLKSLRFTGRKQDILRGDGSFVDIAATSTSWLTTGNSDNSPTLNFLGTIDDQPLRLRINNTWAGEMSRTNVALGLKSLVSNVSGTGNVAIGNNSMGFVQNAINTVAIGDSALHGIKFSEGHSNTAIGAKAMALARTGDFNTAIGTAAMYRNEFGATNVAIGDYALAEHTGPSGSVAVGHEAMQFSVSGESNTGIGNGVMKLSNGSYSVGVGGLAMYSNSGQFNSAIGVAAMVSNSTGNYNTAIGARALRENLTGSENTSVGYFSMGGAIGGNRNTALGTLSLYFNSTGENNIAVGYQALYRNTSGARNIASGHRALYNNTLGSSNIAVGFQSLFYNTSGVSNTSIGTTALSANTTGVNNTALGFSALGTNTTGSLNTAVGMFADVTAGNLVNATAIGYNAKVNASNKVRIGSSAVTKIEGQVPFSTPSDGRFKFNIREDVSGLAFIMKLRPVTYQFDIKRFDAIKASDDVSQASYDKAIDMRRTGFIAQEVEQAANEARYDFNGINRPENSSEYYSLSYESFVVPLVKAIQEQQNIILIQHIELLELKQKNQKDEQALKSQQHQIDLLREEIKAIKVQTSK